MYFSFLLGELRPQALWELHREWGKLSQLFDLLALAALNQTQVPPLFLDRRVSLATLDQLILTWPSIRSWSMTCCINAITMYSHFEDSL